MLLTISTTHGKATDMGYLLHKHPDKFQTFSFAYGNIHVYYPEATEQKCTIAMLLDINPIELIRTKKNSLHFSLAQYVNDRPYVASSFMSVAISKVFSSAMNGKCDAMPDLVYQEMEFDISIPVMPSRGDDKLIANLFEPLGYRVSATANALDEKFEWGNSDYFSTRLQITTTLQQLLTHLYVLIPVLDNEKHYWVGDSEIEKLLTKGKGWLEQHPCRDLITKRYLKYRKNLYYNALQNLETPVENTEENSLNENSLHKLRLQQVISEIQNTKGKTIVDLGCGIGQLLELLLQEKYLKKILGTDASHRVLQIAEKRLYFDDMAPAQRERIELIHSGLTYNDKRIHGYDIATLVEVIEHIDPSRLETFQRILFEFAQPKTIIITTPNSEYNDVYTKLHPNNRRHRDHRFEWTRKEFRSWCEQNAEKYDYTVRYKAIGEERDNLGSPSQMAIFTFK